MKTGITNNHIFHRQQLRKQRPEFVLKVKYGKPKEGEIQKTYDWTAHREAVKKMTPYSFVENK